MSYLIDSDLVADYLKDRAPAVELLDRLHADGAAISVITYGEIMEGIYYGKERTRYQVGWARFLRGTSLIDVDRAIAERFAMIRGELRSQGLLINDPDLLIAATAREYDLTLATRNVRHFGRIPALRLLTQT